MDHGLNDKNVEHSSVLGIHLGVRVWVAGHGTTARRFIEEQLAQLNVGRPADGPIDVAIVAPRTIDEAVYFAGKILDRLDPSGVVWVVGLSGASGIRTEALDQSSEWISSEAGLRLMPVGVVPLSPDGGGFKFRLRES